jgi:ribosome biogenesis GTPase
MRIRFKDGSETEARIKGKRQRPVCGDIVRVEALSGEADWLITGIDERRNTLTRPNRRGEAEVLAANIDTLCAVAAPTPRPDWYIIDRYLSAAELIGAEGIVIYNKSDQLDAATGPPDDTHRILENYRRIGYLVIMCSAQTGDGLVDLGNALSGATSILVGQSGVGKSSLINRLLDAEAMRTGELSGKSREGRHTTVNSVMLDLPCGGYVIDSPGVRDYAPAIEARANVASGFREIHVAAANCRFANCQHMREPGCAVKAGVEAAEISDRRYESYRRLVILTAQLAERRGP